MQGDRPLYTSKSTVKSLWQEYSIFPDRLEIKTHMGDMNIPLDQIEKVDVSESEVKGLLRGDLHLKGFRPAIKVDWANFVEHVVVDKSGGIVHRILFTPEDPREFKEALEKAIESYEQDSGASG